jgi:xanthosine utilization system XapX-like protein
MVIDQTPPVLTLNLGIDTILVGEEWIDESATVIDNSNEAIEIVVTGSVNTSVAGTYEITYTATDSSGNTSSIKRFVTVYE